MSDPAEHEAEQPMIPDELAPRQRTEDPIAAEQDATGTAADDQTGDDEDPVDDRP